jgi:hypothetical protein
MKLQDLHPIDSTILELDNVYHTIGAYSHYINSECIQTPKKIITKGKHYVIASTSLQVSDAIVHKIRLLDAFYNKGHVYMFVMDLNSERVYIVDLYMESPEDKCTWLLYDLKNYDKLKNYTAIKSYCEKGDGAKKKTHDNCKTNITGNDLLEFDYS